MSHILADLKAFAKGYTRNKGAIFFTFMLPILFVLLFGSMFSGQGVSTISLPVQNLDGGQSSVAFLQSLNMTGVVKIVELPASVDLTSYIVDHSLSMALQIPKNFSAQIAFSTADPSAPLACVSLYGDPSVSTFQMAQGVINGAIEGMNFNLAQVKPVVALQSQALPHTQEFTYMDFFLPGVVGMTVMTTAFFSITSICANYRSRGYFKLLATTTIQKYEWLLTKFIFMTILLTVSLLCTYLVGALVFDMKSSLTAMTFVLIAVGAFMFSSMGLLVGSVIKDPESGMAISNAIGFPMMFLSGSFFPVESFPSFLQSVAQVLPLTYLNSGLRNTMVYGNDVTALVDVAIVLVVGLIFAVAGSKLMSWKGE